MVRLARDSAESTGRRRTLPAGRVAGDLAGKGETDDWETFFGPVMRKCTLLDGGVGQIEHLRSRFGTSEPVALSTDARSSFLSTATLDPRGADPLCSIADASGNNFSPRGYHIPRQSTWRKPIYPFYVNHLSRRMANRVGSRGTLSL